MSKGTKGLILLIGVLGIGGWTAFMLWPKGNSDFIEKEISIEQAGLPSTENVIYEDWAGFSFEYPNSLKVEEIEVDNATIYSSLELTATDGQKLTLRIADSQFRSLDEWKENFEAKNVAVSLKKAYWVDMAAFQLNYGAPKKLLTVAVDDGAIYRVESLADDGGFWDQTHQLILNSFEFDESVLIQPQETEITTIEEDEDIILLEEIIE